MSPAKTYAIECVSADTRVLVPADAIEQILEYEASAVPLTAPFVGGVAVVGTALVVSIQLLTDRPDREREKKRTGVLLAAVGTGRAEGLRYAVEVGGVIALVTIVGRRLAPPVREERWCGEATTADGRTLPLLDVDAMLTDLGAFETRGATA
jgi:hypothetical protein